MTQQKLDTILVRIGLDVPEPERAELLKATRFIEEMAGLVRKSRPMNVESAHTVSFADNGCHGA